MSLRMSIKELPKRSTYITQLVAEPLVPTIAAAKTLLSEDEETQTKRFHSPRMLSGGHFAFTKPTKHDVIKPIITSPSATALFNIKLDDEYYNITSGEEFYHDDKIFPYAQAYAGFQFGQFAGQLGDGRVTNLFELNGSDGKWYGVQLKGSGKTPFSRFADGKAVLRSSIREFIASETLHAIGIPTTRAMQLTYLPKTFAHREVPETCAVVTRFSESWVRLGTFDLFRWRKDREGLIQLVDYCIDNIYEGKLAPFEPAKYEYDVYPDPSEKEEQETVETLTTTTKYDEFYRTVVRANAKTVAYWQVYGFLNGVLNTDNTNVLGLSMDFGPFSFLDKFDPNYSPNHDDHRGRYSLANQPSVIWWNLTRFGEAMAELLGAGPDLIEQVKKGNASEYEDQIVKRASRVIGNAANEYKYVFMNTFNILLGRRLGIENATQEDNIKIFEPLLEILILTKCDYNQFFLKLANSDLTDKSIFLSKKLQKRSENAVDHIDHERNKEIDEKITQWLNVYKERMNAQTPESRREISSKANPLFVPRNYMFDQVIKQCYDSKCEDTSLLQKLFNMSTNPYDSSKWGDDLKEKEEEWIRDITEIEEEKSMLQCSCSS